MQTNILENPIFEAVKASTISWLPFLKSKRFVHKDSGKTVKKETVYFDKTQLSLFVSLLSKQVFTDAKPAGLASPQANCCLEVASTDDKSFAAVQLYEYSPFTFHPINELFQLKGQAANEFLNYLASCKQLK